ncbi:MAG: phosphotransferase [Acidimicrobiales bacterium]
MPDYSTLRSTLDGPSFATALLSWMEPRRWALGFDRSRGLRYVTSNITVDERATLIEGMATDEVTKWNVPLALVDPCVAGESGGFVVDGLGFHDAISTPGGRSVISAMLLGRDFGPEALSIPRVEQSNSSIMVDHWAFIKLYRVLREASRREVSIYRALSERRAIGVATLLGDAELFGYPSAIALSYVESEGDLFEVLRRSREKGSSHREIASTLESVGDALATLHRDLSQSLDVTDSKGSSMLMKDAIARCEAVWARLASNDPELADRRQSVLRIQLGMSRRGVVDRRITCQVIHGDLHLGQVLATESGMCFLDFEGEAFEVSSQFLSPAPREYDIAGMLRSIDYLTYGSTDPTERLLYRSAFLDGYRSSNEVAALDEDLLAMSEVEKATYELLYEIHASRGLTSVPLAFLDEMIEQGSVGHGY